MKFFSKKNTAFILLFALILGLFLVNINEAKANVFATAAKDILQGVFWVLLKLAHLFTTLVVNIFTKILNFGFQKMDMVYLGWTITRDIVNMFFILGLIVIAFATILRIETYGMKALLPKLIIIALLINFSYLACGIIIDASQILTNYFMGQIKTNDIGAAVLDTLKVQTALMPEQGATVPVTTSDPEVTLILNMAFSAAIIFVAGFVLLIGAILLFLRIGALWALIILAPFAWFFSIFPALKSHADKWWSEFFKWSFFAPIYVFFIYLVLQIARETSLLSMKGGADSLGEATSMAEMTSNLSLLAYFVFLVILLCGAPTLAMSLGIKAAGTVTAFAKGALKGATLKPIGAGARGLWRKFERSRIGTAIPGLRASREAWKLRKEAKEERAYAPAIGRWRDRLNKTFDHTKTFEENRAKDMLVDAEMGKLKQQRLGKQELSNLAHNYLKAKDYEKFQGAYLTLASRGDEEALGEHPELRQLMDQDLIKEYGLVSKQAIRSLLRNAIPNKEDAIRLAAKTGAMAKGSGLAYLDDMTRYDEKKGGLRWATEQENEKEDIGGVEAMKIAPQKRWREMNRRTILSQNEKGDPVKVTTSFKTMLRILDADDPERAWKEMPGYNKQFIYKAINKKTGKHLIQEEIDTMSGTQKDIAQKWLTGIINAVEGKPFEPGKKKEGEKKTKEEVKKELEDLGLPK